MTPPAHKPIRTWGVVAYKNHPHIEDALPVLRRRAEELGLELVFHASVRPYFSSRTPFPSDAEFVRRSRAILSLGGDGTFLAAARLVHGKRIPILGINFGRLGFLADLEIGEACDQLGPIAAGEFLLEERIMLEASVVRGGRRVHAGLALNEFCLQSGTTSGMIELSVHTDEGFLTDYWADGLLVATPTGSTAYSLALGGPIVQPEVRALLLTPKAPHSLTVRPLLIPDHHRIRVRGRTTFWLLSDGHDQFEVHPGDEVRIRRSRHTTVLLRPADARFPSVLRRKLGWSGSHYSRPKEER